MAKRKRRNFIPEFKAEVVLEALSGESSQVPELCRRHNPSVDQLSKRYIYNRFQPIDSGLFVLFNCDFDCAFGMFQKVFGVLA